MTSGEEVLEAVGPMGAFALADPREPERPRDRLDRAGERQVLDAVPARRRRRRRLDRPHRRASRTSRTKEALLVLHRAGLVEHSLGPLAAHSGPARRLSAWAAP